MEMMTRALAIDWAAHGVRVNTLAPGYTVTDLTQGLRRNEGLSARLLQKIPQGRFARPDEMAGAAIFLVSSASSYVTGQTILVDGGWTST
jgi:NAD(P)-dependent dehydrogenase (short-subunit alcohol dehydrogenase family)